MVPSFSGLNTYQILPCYSSETWRISSPFSTTLSCSSAPMANTSSWTTPSNNLAATGLRHQRKPCWPSAWLAPSVFEQSRQKNKPLSTPPPICWNRTLTTASGSWLARASTTSFKTSTGRGLLACQLRRSRITLSCWLARRSRALTRRRNHRLLARRWWH